jgi:hypothetical protein
MAYDSESDQIIMFGGELGRTGSFIISDATWAYDVGLNQWTEMHPSDKPTGVVGHGMAYDSESDRVILYGGGGETNRDLDQTWAYDYNANTWTELASGPNAREGIQMVYDSESDRIILFGGIEVRGDAFNDTWSYDFNTDTWENLEPTDSPSARGWHNMIYDTESNRVILWEGEMATDDNVWAYDYDTNTWTELEPDEKPVFANGYFGFGAMAYDEESNRAISFGGGYYSDNHTNNETWVYDYNSNAWMHMEPTNMPGERTLHQMVYHSASDLIVLYGGRDGSGYLYTDETWIYDYNTNTWTNMTLSQE